MRALLQRLFAARRQRPVFSCYLRENGPIAYELELFGNAPRDRADAMMSGELAWAWKGAAREWTHLTRISLSAFLGDPSSDPHGDPIPKADGTMANSANRRLSERW